MSDTRAETVRALAEALFPGLHQDAEMAQSANQEAIATFFVTSAAKMDFVIAAVSSWLLSSAEALDIHILCEAPTPGWASWQHVYLSPGYLSAHDGGSGCHRPGHHHTDCQGAWSARHVQSVTQVMHNTPCLCAGNREHGEVDSRNSEGAGPVSPLLPWASFIDISHVLCPAELAVSSVIACTV